MAGQNNTLVSGDNDSMTGQYEYTSISSTSTVVGGDNDDLLTEQYEYTSKW